MLVRNKEDLSDEDIQEFQLHTDLFFQEWVRLHARDGITNYIHMLGSGHIAEYLTYWRNLYSHSQQGWEAFNSLLKTYYFRCTARGGAANKGLGEKLKIRPLARWLQRRLMWMYGKSFKEMEDAVKTFTHVDNETEKEGADFIA